MTEVQVGAYGRQPVPLSLQPLSNILMKKSMFELIKMFGCFLKFMSDKTLGVHLDLGYL